MERSGLRLMQAHGRKVRTNIREGSEEFEAMVALENIYGLRERRRVVFGVGGVNRREKNSQNLYTSCHVPKLIKSVSSGR